MEVDEEIMEPKIKTYKEKPDCEVPGCPVKGLMLIANRWICGDCFLKWRKKQQKREQEANDVMFKDIVEATK